jgi:acetate kinase
MRFVQPVRIDDAVLQALEQLVPLAPLHQPNGLAGVRAAMAAFPGVPQIACFDTAFHAGQPEVNQRFALPRALHDAGVRRYGFHGLSYESVMAQLALIDLLVARGRVVVAHLGNGASLCAIHDGKSVATTMSFSPLDGLTMGTRCGQLDAAVVLYLMQARGMAAEQITNLLYRESGLLGLSGVSSDMRELQASRLPEAAQAVTHFVEQVLQNLGKLAAAMRGLDALVFTGGIGENATDLRARIMAGAAWLGLESDPGANQSGASRISAPGSAVSAWVVKTNEEAMIARHSATLLS